MKKIFLILFLTIGLFANAQQNLIQNTGSIGIGTLNPYNKLDVQSINAANFGTSVPCCAASYTIGISENTQSNSRMPSIQFHASGWQEAFFRLASEARIFEIGDNQSVGVDFAIRNQANTTRNVLLSGKGNSFLNGGNVGIGTNNPLQILHVNGNEIFSTGSGAGFKFRDRNSLTTDDWVWYSNENVARFWRSGFGDILTANTSGSIGIGSLPQAGYKFAVNGFIKAKEVKISMQNWADFVFAPNYKINKLEDVEKFIKANRHLPEIPSEKEVLENGITLGEMNAKLLQKIEELTLYVIEQEKQMKFLKNEIKELKSTLRK